MDISSCSNQLNYAMHDLIGRKLEVGLIFSVRNNEYSVENNTNFRGFCANGQNLGFSWN